MLKIRTILTLSAIGILASISNAQTTKLAASDEAAVRHVVQNVQDAWNAHDGKAFALQFAEDADYVVVNGMFTKGRKEIEAGHTMIFSTIYKDSRNVATIKHLRFLRPDQAIVHVEWNLEFTVSGTLNKARALNTMVIGRRPVGGWLIDVFQNTPIQAGGGRPSGPPSKP